jgi:hypothetical protein
LATTETDGGRIERICYEARATATVLVDDSQAPGKKAVRTGDRSA